MTTNFPDAIDGYTDPVGPQTLATNHHKQRHIDLQDAMVAVQTTVGVSGSDDPNSIEYRVTQASAAAGGAASALAAHEEAADPHPVYTTQSEVEATVSALAPAETASTIGAIISGATGKATPVDADKLMLSDSAGGGVGKAFSFANLKTVLSSLFAQLAGVAGGQILNGGTGAGDQLTLNSTSHATKGNVFVAGFAYFSQLLSRLGIGVSSPTARVHIQAGTAAAGTAPLKIDAGTPLTTPEDGAIERTSGGLFFTPSAAVGRQRLATQDEAAQALTGYPSGSGELLIPLGGLTPVDTVATDDAIASWKIPATAYMTWFGDLIPINNRQAYIFRMWLRAGENDGSLYSAANRNYVGFQCYDARRRTIQLQHSSIVAGSALTTLAAPLNIGDTTMTLTDATGWANGETNRSMGWGPYTDEDGRVYPDYGYTRNTTVSLAGYSSGAWAAGAVSGNNPIPLVAPWPGPALPAGTKVRNALTTGFVAPYAIMRNAAISQAWTLYEALIGGQTLSTTADLVSFRPGTAYIAPIFTMNQHGVGDTVYRVKGMSISPAAYPNQLPRVGIGTSYRSLAQLSLPTDGLAVQGRIGAGTSSPAAAIHGIASSALLRMGYDTSNYFTVDVTSVGVAMLTTVGTAPALAIAGDVRLDKTITPAGTTGAQTIHKQMGSVNIAAGQSSVVVTNNRVTLASFIFPSISSNDATLKSVTCVAANGSFTLTGNAAATMETKVNFLVLN